jgi:hypothetical protein
MKKLSVAVMVVLGLSGLAWGTPIFFDDFSASTFTGWTVTQSTGTVTNGKEGYYAELYSPSSKFSAARLKTVDTFTIGDGLVVDVTMMFARNDPGYGVNLTYRPNMAIQDAAGVKRLAVYSPFASGTTSAPIKMQTLNSGTLADTYATSSVGTSAWYRFVIDVYTNHADVQMYRSSGTLIDQWSATYDSMDSFKLAFNADDPGWWPASRLLVDKAGISAIPEPVTLILLGLGAVFGIRKK